jgi:D-alanine-D-alanine ligase-like ATP-grasp enzyme
MHREFDRLKIAVLHPSYQESDSPFKEMDPPCDPARYMPDLSCTNFEIHKRTAVQQVLEIAQQGFDVYFNLCDGAWAEDRPGIEVVQAMERLNLAFTGAGSPFYEPSREAMKMACAAVGVKFPAYVAVSTGNQDECATRAAATLRYPMIVKHPNSYASVGLTRESRVTGEAALRREIARMTAAYGGALVEEFIEGREFTVLAAEPREGERDPWVFTPVEFSFPDGETFKHFDLKWIRFHEMHELLVNDEALSARLREVAALTFSALGGSGFGRCDIRMDEAGDLYMLEINPQCEIFCPEGGFGSADLVLANDPAGHSGFARHLLMCALRRQERAARPWQIRYDRKTGFGMYAARNIRAGEIVEPYEERPCTLVSPQHVQRNWHGFKRDWFDRYAWPVADGVHGIWSADPAEWRPINHSCDPNVWLEGLDFVARRDIPAGEELCADYATFCGPEMKPFECLCTSSLCRITVRGTDYLLPELRERYRDHVSAYVRQSAG